MISLIRFMMAIVLITAVVFVYNVIMYHYDSLYTKILRPQDKPFFLRFAATEQNILLPKSPPPKQIILAMPALPPLPPPSLPPPPLLPFTSPPLPPPHDHHKQVLSQKQEHLIYKDVDQVGTLDNRSKKAGANDWMDLKNVSHSNETGKSLWEHATQPEEKKPNNICGVVLACDRPKELSLALSSWSKFSGLPVTISMDCESPESDTVVDDWLSKQPLWSKIDSFQRSTKDPPS